jgi:hypothetical protein
MMVMVMDETYKNKEDGYKVLQNKISNMKYISHIKFIGILKFL